MASKCKGRILHVCERLHSRDRRIFTSVTGVSLFLGVDRRVLQSSREKLGVYSKGEWVVIFDSCELDV